MPANDRLVVTKRLAALERKLLVESKGFFPPAPSWGGPEHCHGFVQVIKNFGAPVGGSVAHGHQQIALVNVMPRRVRDDWQFEQTHGETFSEHILRENPRELELFDYGPARLMVPYFMRRPYDMMLVFKDARPRYLHELDEDSLAAFSDGWRDGIRLMRAVLTSLGRNIAYNIVVHAGPGAGVYVEFLPYTQEVGGLEQSGLWICQASPNPVAQQLRALNDDSSA
jgi:galactose-1-phosphate uridylyltransferase